MKLKADMKTLNRNCEFYDEAKILNLIVDLLNRRKNRVLLVAQSSMQDSQFKAFRKVFLDEFGRNGLESEIFRFLGNRNGQE